MTLKQLEYILAVQRTGSISQVAKKLYVSHSSISNSIIALEQELGFPLFKRSQTGLVPTPQGIRVLELAGRVCENCRLMTQLEQPVARRLRIGASSHEAFEQAFFRLARSCQERSDFSLSYCVIESLQQTLRQLQVGELDVALVLLADHRAELNRKLFKAKGLHSTVLKTLPAVVNMGPGNPLYTCPAPTVYDFIGQPCVAGPNGLLTIHESLRALLNLSPEQIIFVNNYKLRRQLVAQEPVYTIECKLPPRVEQEYHLRSVPIGDIIRFQLTAVTTPNTACPQEVGEYLALVKEELAGL